MDSSLTPKPFNGKPSDLSHAERWLQYFRQYVTYKHLRDVDALALFRLLLVEDAHDWLMALPGYHSDSFNGLCDAFRSRYFPNELQRFQMASTLWSRVQQPNESVETFVTAMQTAANKIHLQDDQQLIFCIIRGFKPNIRLHVLQNNHNTIAEVLHSARVAEIAAVGIDGTDQVVAELSKTVSVLVNKLATRDLHSTAAESSSSASLPLVANVNDQCSSQTRPQQNASGRTSWRGRRQSSITSQPQRPPAGQRQQYSSPSYAAAAATTFQPSRPQMLYQQTVQSTGHNVRPFDVETQHTCGNCGTHHSLGVCPAYGKVCHNCQKANHFSRVCRSRRNFVQHQNYMQ